MGYITRNTGHFGPAVQKCSGFTKLQFSMLCDIDYKMATKRGGRVDYKALHNLSSLDLITAKKRKRKQALQSKIYTIERLISRRETPEVSSWHIRNFWTCDYKIYSSYSRTWSVRHKIHSWTDVHNSYGNKQFSFSSLAVFGTHTDTHSYFLASLSFIWFVLSHILTGNGVSDQMERLASLDLQLGTSWSLKWLLHQVPSGMSNFRVFLAFFWW